MIPALEITPPDLRVVHRSARRKLAEEHSLVLQSMSVPHYIAQDGAEHLLLVESEDEPRAREQLELYARERGLRTGVEIWPSDWYAGLIGALGWAGVLALVNALDTVGAFERDWRATGISEAGRIRAGEWWRAFTALTLHADGAHLVSNLVFGALFTALLCQMSGAALGWLAILAAGAAGNALNAWVRGPEHLSLGASTAVFGAIGLLVGLELLRLRRSRAGFFRRWAALGMGLFLFSWLGTSGVRTDIGAHAAGFACGAPLALPLAWLMPRVHGSKRLALLLGFLPPALLAAVWVLAFARV